jgi:hypothetical protein
MGRRGAALIRTGGDGSVGTTVGTWPAGEAEAGSGAEAAGRCHSTLAASMAPPSKVTAPGIHGFANSTAM